MHRPLFYLLLGILVAAAPTMIPPALEDQLAEDGALVMPVGSTLQELKVMRKRDCTLVETDTLAVRFVPLVD